MSVYDNGVKMTEVALGLRYFHPSCFHPFLDSSSYLVWTLKCLWNVRPAFSRKKSNFQKCRPMSKSPSGMNQSRILINTVTYSTLHPREYARPRKYRYEFGLDCFIFLVSIQNVFSHNGLLYRDEFCKRIIYATGNLKF